MSTKPIRWISNRVLILVSCIIMCLPHLGSAQDLEQIGKEKPVQFSGGLGLGAWAYASNGIENRRTPYSWYLTGSPTLTLYGLTLPFSFTVSEQQRYFSQPFNQFGVSPHYKWLTLHAGYRSMYFSDFSLAGEVFLGGGVDIKPGKLRASAMYGRLRRAIEEQDSTSATPILSLPATYKRMGYGAKVGVGTNANYFDFFVFRAWDDTLSLERAPTALTESPRDNLVIGIKTGFLIARKLSLDFDGSASALTRDTRAPLSVDIPGELEPVSKVLSLNNSTALLTAYRASLNYQIVQSASVAFRVTRIEPGYESLGIHYLQSDVLDYTLAPRWRMLGGKLSFNTSLGVRQDNINGLKTATSSRNIGSAYVSINPSQKWGLDFNYSNYGISQSSGLIQLNDSIRVSMVNQTMGSTFRLVGVTPERASTFVMVFNYNDLSDRNEYTRDFTESRSYVWNSTYSHGLLKSGLTLTGSLSYTLFTSQLNRVTSLGPVAGVQKSFFDKKLNTGLTMNIQSRTLNDERDGNVFQVSFTTSYVLKKKHTIGLDGYYTRNSTSNLSSYSFNEQRISFRYAYVF